MASVFISGGGGVVIGGRFGTHAPTVAVGAPSPAGVSVADLSSALSDDVFCFSSSSLINIFSKSLSSCRDLVWSEMQNIIL